MTKQAIADAYGISRQRVYQLCKNHSLTADDFADPDKIFERLLEGAFSSPLRERLADYSVRESIRQTLNH